ncbi:hypothetical protein HZS61_004575 [Fusarium oxysporum f. sp. conglutinans]|uniref:GDP-mannose transporter n=1 Tax=Fusarium oxysporum f. sp. conglutinans TaxID=100902 RepID=A0A8H6GCM8_FUSOX|nr:hypothetical protein HZS61_004575 [Fusarium oxysporum f. sp. conglutinans]
MSQEVRNKSNVDGGPSTSASPGGTKETTVIEHVDSNRELTRSPSEFELDCVYHDEEAAALLPEERWKPEIDLFKTSSGPHFKSILWTVVNVLATVLIVFTNKAIFSDPSLKLAQLTFAAFHFTITWLALYVLSWERFAIFSPKSASFRQAAPLSVAMALNVVFPNLSLAYSTVAFYQIARILMTPCVAAMDFVLYKVVLPFRACLALVPACVGVGMVSYYDSRPTSNTTIKATSELGVIFAFAGVFFSSLYTIWIAASRRRLNMTSMQLLFNQAPVSAFMLLYTIPFIDRFPDWSNVSLNHWFLLLLSGFLAVLINVSQFFIVAEMGPVTSTVVAHSKTCIIVALGWLSSGRTPLSEKSPSRQPTPTSRLCLFFHEPEATPEPVPIPASCGNGTKPNDHKPKKTALAIVVDTGASNSLNIVGGLLAGATALLI